jgi:hypothetical protein
MMSVFLSESCSLPNDADCIVERKDWRHSEIRGDLQFLWLLLRVLIWCYDILHIMLKFQTPIYEMFDVRKMTKLSVIRRPFFRILAVSWCLSTTASKSSSPHASHSAVTCSRPFSVNSAAWQLRTCWISPSFKSMKVLGTLWQPHYQQILIFPFSSHSAGSSTP